MAQFIPLLKTFEVPDNNPFAYLQAKTIDLCNNPKTKEPKLKAAQRIIAEWPFLDELQRNFTESMEPSYVADGYEASSNLPSSMSFGQKRESHSNSVGQSQATSYSIKHEQEHQPQSKEKSAADGIDHAGDSSELDTHDHANNQVTVETSIAQPSAAPDETTHDEL